MSINNNNKKKTEKKISTFNPNLFGKTKTNNDNNELMKNIKQELKNKANYKPEFTVLQKYNMGIELILCLSELDYEKAKKLIKMGANVKAKDEEGNTPLIIAARNAPTEILKLLIDNGAKANINEYNNNGETKGVYASIFNEKNVLEYLIDNGALVDLNDYDGQTPLMYAAEYNNYENVEILIYKGANVTRWDKYGKNALMHVLPERDYDNEEEKMKIIKKLVEHGINIKKKDNSNQNSISHSAHKTSVDILKYLINMSYNHSEEEIFSYLENALDSNKIENSKYLIEYLIDNFNTEKTVEKIIDLKLNTIGKCNSSEYIGIDIIKLLIENIGMVNKRDSNGNTLLHAACEKHDWNSIEYLIENGADITIENYNGKTPYMLAFEKSDDETVEKIIEILNKNNQKELALELKELLNYGVKIEYSDIELDDEELYTRETFEKEFIERYNGRIVNEEEALGERR